MNTARRKTCQSVVNIKVTGRRQVRQYASGSHGSSSEHGHHHASPTNESFGTGFYVAVGLIPTSMAVYYLSQPSEDGSKPAISRLINSYSDYKESWTARNSLHTAMVEQAAFDRNLFQSAPTARHVDLRFPETFNTGSPYNVSAGQGGIHLDKVVAHYEKLNAEEDIRKKKALAAKEAGK